MEFNTRKFRNKHDEIKALRKRRGNNLEKIIQDKIEIDSKANRLKGAIPPGKPSAFDVAKCGIKHPRTKRYMVYVPSNHPYYRKYRLQGWELRSRLVWLIYSGWRSIPAFHEIHHINHNRDDDDPKNLRCVSIREHRKTHFLSKQEEKLLETVRSIDPRHYRIEKAYQEEHPGLIRLTAGLEAEIRRRAKILGVHPTKALATEIALRMQRSIDELVTIILKPKKA